MISGWGWGGNDLNPSQTGPPPRARGVGGGEEGGGGGRGRGAPPGRKLNINQSIAGSRATQRRRGCGGGRGTGAGRVGGREEGGGGSGEAAVGKPCGRDRARGAAEDRGPRTECRASGGCSRAQRAPGRGVCSSSSSTRRVQGAAASPSPEARSSRRGGGSDQAGAGCLVSPRRRRPARGRWPRPPGLRVPLAAPSTFDFGDRRATASPTPASAHRPPPPPLGATFRGACELPLGAEPAGRARRARGEGRCALRAGTIAGPEQWPGCPKWQERWHCPPSRGWHRRESCVRGAEPGASLDEVPGALAAPATSRSVPPEPPGGRAAVAARATGPPDPRLRGWNSGDLQRRGPRAASAGRAGR